MLYDLTDWLIGPLKSLLGTIVGWLAGMSLQAAHGIVPARYLGAAAWLPAAWLGLLATVIKCAVLYLLLYVGKAGYGLYLDIKAGVKWW